MGGSWGARRSRKSRRRWCATCASKETRPISSRQIRKKILTAKTGWWPFATKQYFDPVSWEADLRRIVRLYETRGYYQARIAHEAAIPQPKGVALEVKVEEGQVTKVGTLDFRGLEALPAADREAALVKMPLKVGAPFEESDWESAKSGIIPRLHDRGYAKATVEGEALVDVKTHLAAVTIVVHPGVRYHFGAIDVKTAPESHVPAVFVWEQARLAIHEGALYSDDALEEAERRIFGMGVFGSVNVSVGTPDDATAVLPVVVTVREAPFRTLRLGAGVVIDQIHEEARLIGDWTHRNFLGGTRKLTIHAEAGWAFLPNIYAVATNDLSVAPRNGPVADLGATFEQPRLGGHPTLKQQNSIDLARTIEQTYDNLGGRTAAGVVWQPRARVSIFPAYHLEVDYLNGSPINSAATAPLTLGCQTTSGSCTVVLSYIEQVVTWDHRDKPLEPRNGFYTSLSLQEGGGPLQGDFGYLRVLPDVRAYVSFLDDNALTFAARLQVGELWPITGESAVVIRFYGGGANSMRGFSERRLSPLLQAPVPGNPGNAGTRHADRDGAHRRQRHVHGELRGPLLGARERAGGRLRRRRSGDDRPLRGERPSGRAVGGRRRPALPDPHRAHPARPGAPAAVRDAAGALHHRRGREHRPAHLRTPSTRAASASSAPIRTPR